MWWEKRILDPNFRSLTVTPRVFLIMSHQDNDQHRIVCKLQRENLYQRGQRFFGLDPRGMCIVQTETALFIWVGGELFPANRVPYLE